MAVVVSHAMRRFPSSPPDAVYSYGLRGEGSHKPWSKTDDGESALSRSMRYADPWLYGSVRAPSGLVLTPAFVLCACSDYINGTKRSSKKTPTTCKKCKGTRLPLSPSGDTTKFGTVRCYPTTHPSATSTPLRAGTMRASSTSARPSILPSADPYDLMRRSRLSVSESSSQFRARSTSPNKARTNESRSLSGTRAKNNSVDAFHSPSSRRSILECDINPYELMSSETEIKDSSITLVNGQRIRVRPPSAGTEYEDVKSRPQPTNQTSKLQIKNKNPTSPKLSEKESESNRFKSILKKRTTTFSDTDSNSCEHSPSPARKSGTHFYLPMPGNTPRKKVQFLVENELVCQEPNNRKDELNYDNVGYDEPSSLEKLSDTSLTTSEDETQPIKRECKLRRSISEYYNHGSNKVIFHDTMALRSRNTRTDSRMTFGNKDLEKLDGLSSRNRKISPTKLRPNEPPPPPPPSIEISEEESVSNSDEQYDTVEKLPSQLVDNLQTIEKDDIVLENFNSSKQEIKVKNDMEAEKINETLILNSKPVIEKSSEVIKERNDDIKKMEKLDMNKKSLKLDVEKNVPPCAPPRKRSNNKQPQINIVQNTPLTTQTVKISSPLPNEFSANKTVVQINGLQPVHKLQIKNEFSETVNVQTVSVLENPQRKTSIMINGDDCYSTVNVNDDVPLYQSSVVVKDTGIESFPCLKNNKKTSSSVYISGNFIPPTRVLSPELNKDELKPSNNEANKITKNNSVDLKSEQKNIKDCKKIILESKLLENPKNENNILIESFNENDIPSSEVLKEILKDPVEAVRRNLVPHVCGKSDVTRRPNERTTTTNNVNDVLQQSSSDNPKNLLEESFLRLKNYASISDDVSSEHSSSTQYELMDTVSECYTDHSNRSSVTEEELANRTKFYELLADSAVVEVAENEDHHYESIKTNPDPIYEEIEIPPPLPTNPPPTSLLDDLQLDKEYTTRSIFEGASKYDILSYLVDAKERGIVQEDNYTYAFGNPVVTPEEDTKESYNRVSHLSTVSDSSEENSLIISGALIDEKATCQKPAEVERNDSGVGSETSKCSLSKYRTKQEISIVCEDCESVIDFQTENEPLICRKCAKKRSERKEIITEIVETEEKYSRDLQIILEEFYQPMLVAGLLTPEQLSTIFLNAEELLENSQGLAERLRDAVEIAVEQGDEDLLTVNIGKLFLEAAPMLHGFETYCVRQGAASLLLASLEKEKELLRIFLRVSQMENTMLRRMNLNSFLMVPVQRVTKYPLLLARLYKVTPNHHNTKDQLKDAQHKIELHLNHMNSETKDVPSKLWRRIGSSSGRRSSAEMDLVNIKLRKIAVDVLEWNHDEAKFAMEGRLLYTQPADNNWRKGRTIKLTPVNALLVINGKPSTSRVEKQDENGLIFSRPSVAREAALLLVRDKNGRYSLLREPLYLDRCVIASDPAWQSYFEVQELLGKDTFIFKAEDEDQTKSWYNQLQYHSQGLGAWRKRRNALANIMINGMGLRS